jgi:hypothetical protein
MRGKREHAEMSIDEPKVRRFLSLADQDGAQALLDEMMGGGLLRFMTMTPRDRRRMVVVFADTSRAIIKFAVLERFVGLSEGDVTSELPNFGRGIIWFAGPCPAVETIFRRSRASIPKEWSKPLGRWDR